MKDKCKDCYFSDNGDCTCSGVKMCVSSRDERRRRMTNTEAQNVIVRNKGIFKYDPTMNEALYLAVKALEFIEENYPKTFDDYLKGEE